MTTLSPRALAVSELIVEVFRANGALLAAGDALSRPAGLTSARWQVLGVIDHRALTVADTARARGLRRQSVQQIANTGNRAGFSVVDPGGNVIRFLPFEEDAEAKQAPESRVGRTLVKAIVLGDAKGDAAQAARLLDATLAKSADEAPTRELVEALAYRAELAVRLDEQARARELVDATALAEAEREQLTAALAAVEDLRRQLP